MRYKHSTLSVVHIIEIECVDSPFKLIHSGDVIPRPCSVAKSLFGCTSEVSSHCPWVCDSCSAYKCSDSSAVASNNGDTFECSSFTDLTQEELDIYCDNGGILATCRSTCNYCEVAPSYTPSYVPSLAPSYTPSPTVLGFVNMNFDENELDLDTLFDDYGYYDLDYTPYSYFHPDLVLNNFGFYPGHASPDTGYYYGVITPQNVAFNEYGDPATMECPGGSFSIESMWVTSAWLPDAPVGFYGLKSDGSTVSFSVVLPTIDSPVFVDGEFDDFTDLIYFTIDTPREGDVAAMDDFNLSITEPCMVSDSLSDNRNERNSGEYKSIKNPFSIINDEDNPRPDFAPIFPRE